jgi:signal transduction histidine kinase/CheY-like chemotaxis protein
MMRSSSLVPKTMLGQILSGFSLVLVIFTFCLLSTHGYFESNFFKDLEHEKGRNMTSMLSEISTTGLYTESSFLVDPQIDAIFNRPIVTSVSLYRADGSLWITKKKDSYTLPDLSPDEVKRFIEVDQIPPKPYTNGDNISFAMPVKLTNLAEFPSEITENEENEEILGLIHLSISQKYYGSLIHKGRLLDIGSISIAAFFSIIAAFLLARKLSKPVHQLTEGAKRISEGKFEEELSSNVQGELAELIKNFNQMQEALKDREQLMNELQQSQKLEAIGTLAGGIAHDFNNILSAIMGYGELTQKRLLEDSKEYEYLGHILKAGDRAKDLVAQILTFSRQSLPHQVPTDIEPIAKEVLKLLRASLPSNIEIKSTIETGGYTILTDPTRIHQIIMNLCTNSYHAMEEQGGILEVNLAHEKIDEDQAACIPDLNSGNYLHLSIKDNGCGIEQKILDRMFDPFFTTKERGKGTGMGLSLVHGIMKENGGCIVIDSEVGKGTCFHLYFPVLKTSYGENATHLFPSLKKGTGRILFVDDEEEISKMGKQMLEFLGYDVTTYTSSVEAFEFFEARPDMFDIVITDQTMPEMSGTQLTQNLLSIRPDLAVILGTGHSTVVSAENAAEFGIREFLMKPYTLQKFSDAIHRILSID